MAIRHIIAMTNSDANRTNCMLQRITSSLSTQYCQRSKQSVANELGIVRIIPIRIGNPRSVRFPFLPRQILPPSVARRKSNSANSIRALLVLGEGKFAALNSPMPNSHTANIPKQKEFRYIRISQVSDEFATVGIIPGFSGCPLLAETVQSLRLSVSESDLLGRFRQAHFTCILLQHRLIPRFLIYLHQLNHENNVNRGEISRFRAHACACVYF